MLRLPIRFENELRLYITSLFSGEMVNFVMFVCTLRTELIVHKIFLDLLNDYSGELEQNLHYDTVQCIWSVY